MHCDVQLIKFEIEIQLMYGEAKKTNWIKQTKLYILEGKLNQIIVQRVIQTLAIVQESNLDFSINVFTYMQWQNLMFGALSSTI